MVAESRLFEVFRPLADRGWRSSRLEITVAPWQWQLAIEATTPHLLSTVTTPFFGSPPRIWVKNLDEEFGSSLSKRCCEASLDHIENVTIRRDVLLQVVHG
jgi:hypothetical protein